MPTPVSTPLYDTIAGKARDWSNKREAATVPDSVINDCLEYSANDCYEKLRIPPLEATANYVVSAQDNPVNTDHTRIPIPSDLVEFIYVKKVPLVSGEKAFIYDEIADNRTFFNAFAEKYSSHYWTWKDDYLYIYPQLKVDDEIEIQYYRRLQAMNATYAVDAINYILGVADNSQPFLTLTTDTTDTPLYFSTGVDGQRVFNTLAEAQAYNSTVTTKYYIGKEADNWLKRDREQLLLWGALHYLGSYLFDEQMEARYGKRFFDSIESINKEEKKRRALGGNVQMNVNTGGLI
jgi:hypothetical protein